MEFLSDIMHSMPFDCPYVKGQRAAYDVFYANNLNGEELTYFLSRGWRKFSTYFFRPQCPGCRLCIPVRVCAFDFDPSKSQRRIIKNNENVTVRFEGLQFTDELFEIYKNHSHTRFNREVNLDEFKRTFFQPPCESLLSKYYYNTVFFAGGFLDVASDALSSIYFVYQSEYSRLSPGNYSTIAEINQAREMQKPYYYLGYYIEQNHHMNYKNRFFPYEFYNWEEEGWERHEK